eukprot:6902839-Pyramimonas_sp.AAC.1
MPGAVSFTVGCHSAVNLVSRRILRATPERAFCCHWSQLSPPICLRPPRASIKSPYHSPKAWEHRYIKLARSSGRGGLSPASRRAG